jgi:hypothetical protein
MTGRRKRCVEAKYPRPLEGVLRELGILHTAS